MNRSSFEKNKQKTDRMIMITATVIVLVAFTLVGVYVRERDQAQEFDGYVVDLSELNNDVKDKADELGGLANHNEIPEGFESVDSENIKIDGLMEQYNEINNEVKPWEAPIASIAPESDLEMADYIDYTIDEILPLPEDNQVLVEYYDALEFNPNNGLNWPVSGEILIPYSVDTTVYFSTLDQYKVNDAIIIAALESSSVYAATAGKVIEYYIDNQIGETIVMEVGNGFKITYGQLKDVSVSIGEYVENGQQFANIAAPTKYYSVEGYNLYLKITENEISINPLSLLTED